MDAELMAAIRQRADERCMAQVQYYIAAGKVVAWSEGRCDRWPCDGEVVVEDKLPSDGGRGVRMCARHFCERNGLR